VQGALGGVVAALAYDLYRLPFVLGGAPLFKVFPRFGQLLLGASEPTWLVQLLGWSYHFSNGAALGIMFLAMLPRPRRRVLLGGAVAWALFIEGMLLLTPYTQFFRPRTQWTLHFPDRVRASGFRRRTGLVVSKSSPPWRTGGSVKWPDRLIGQRGSRDLCARRRHLPCYAFA